jgi:hypothetical protein
MIKYNNDNQSNKLSLIVDYQIYSLDKKNIFVQGIKFCLFLHFINLKDYRFFYNSRK